MTSGQHVEEYVFTRWCRDCDYLGPADVWYDPELGWGGWTCPNCQQQITQREGVTGW